MRRPTRPCRTCCLVRPPSRSISRPAFASALESLTAPFLHRPTPSHLSNLRDGAGAAVLSGIDPLRLVGQELGSIRENVRRLLGSRHPALDTIAKYYLGSSEGKHIRPLIVLLVSQATNGLSPAFEVMQRTTFGTGQDGNRKASKTALNVDEPLSASDVLDDPNPDIALPVASSTCCVLPTQRRLAEITEMIHVASLLHDDVIDQATSRRGRPSCPSRFGNKLSILAGDFLLARASVALSRLGSLEVVELVASALANLVEGEVMQMKGNTPADAGKGNRGLLGMGGVQKLTPEIFDYYMQKTYLKTASLVAKSARAATILGGCGARQGWAAGEAVKDGAYSFGRNLGIAFQLTDDSLDFTASSTLLGKPAHGADLKLGLATAPALYAWEEYPELGCMIERKFEEEGDVERARDLILKSSGIARTQELAAQHAQKARDALNEFPETEARQALDDLTLKTLNRKK